MTLEELNRIASSLSEQQIADLSDEQILSMAMERPGHPGQRGFMLNPRRFRSPEHLSKTIYALGLRLDKAQKSERELGAASPTSS